MSGSALPGDLGQSPGPGPDATLGALGSGAMIVDGQGRVVTVNALGAQMLGHGPGQLIDCDAHDMLHRNAHGDSVPRTQCGLRRAFLARRTAQQELDWFIRHDGTLLPISWLVTPYLGSHDGAGALVLFHSAEQADDAPTAGAGGPRRLSELERLALLAETTTQMTSTLSGEEALRRLVALVAPRLADWVVIDLITEHDEVWRTVVVHAEEGLLVAREELQGPMSPVPESSPMPLSRALRGAASTLTGPSTYRQTPDSGLAIEQRRLFQATGIQSAAIAPIRGTRHVLGALTLGRAEQPEPFTSADLPLVEDIARRAGIALDNARLYQRQRKVAETMQRYLLPLLPRVEGLQMTSRYQSAPDASQVGGDWYDAFPLQDGVTALAIGDVVGHDLDAAAGMAQVRNMLRAYAWAHQETPARIVARLDQALLHITEVPMATLVFARISRDTDRGWQLSWTNAGHPPPLLVTRDGLTRYLEDGHGLLLGTGAQPHREDAADVLPPGSTLLLYTDGLIEAPGRSLDEGLARLRQNAASLAHHPLESFTDQLLQRTRPTDNDDDVALLVVRTPR